MGHPGASRPCQLWKVPVGGIRGILSFAKHSYVLSFTVRVDNHQRLRFGSGVQAPLLSFGVSARARGAWLTKVNFGKLEWQCCWQGKHLLACSSGLSVAFCAGTVVSTLRCGRIHLGLNPKSWHVGRGHWPGFPGEPHLLSVIVSQTLRQNPNHNTPKTSKQRRKQNKKPLGMASLTHTSFSPASESASLHLRPYMTELGR